MLRLSIAVLALWAASGQSLASAIAPQFLHLGVCGQVPRERLPLIPQPREHGGDCAAACHFACRRADISGDVDDDDRQPHP